MVMINSHGVEVSVTEGVVEMVHDPNPTFIFFAFFSLLFIRCFDFYVWVQRLQAALAMIKKNHG